MKRLLFIALLVGLAWGQDCTADDGTDGVELWGECYSIENTTSLNLESSGLTGEIPESIGNLTNLTDLRLQGNQLTGSIPPEIGNLMNLTQLWLSSNQLTGEIPSEIGNLTNLTRLYLSLNELTGSIPPEIGILTNLSKLYLGENQLTGSIPPEIGNLTNLIILKLHSNQFSSVSDSICNLTYLSWSLEDDWSVSNIYNNQLCPPYPSCIEDYVGGQDTTNCSSMSITDILPTHYNLSQPYPNPFNPTTIIQFSLPQSEMVSMKVYDLNGRLIETLLNDFYDMGNHTITWDGSSQSSGMYFVRLESGEFIQTRKVVLVK